MSVSPFSNQALVNWLSSKDPKKSYDYANCRNCLIAQYLREALGARRFSVSVSGFDMEWRDAMGQRCHTLLPPGWDSIARAPGRKWDDDSYTYGKALERALAYEMA